MELSAHYDCGTDDGIVLTSRVENGEISEHVGERALGRVALDEVKSNDGTVIFPKNHMFTEKDLKTIEDEDIDQIAVRSVLTCKEKYGFCAKCFGRDLARGTLVSVGEAVGLLLNQLGSQVLSLQCVLSTLVVRQLQVHRLTKLKLRQLVLLNLKM
jgi:hypothetical protein